MTRRPRELDLVASADFVASYFGVSRETASWWIWLKLLYRWGAVVGDRAIAVVD